MDSGLFGILQLLIYEEPGDFQLFRSIGISIHPAPELSCKADGRIQNRAGDAGVLVELMS
jgi:hypothetical protein